MWKRLGISLILVGLSLASSNDNETPKYFLKSLADPSKGNYYPLRISYEVDESSFRTALLNKTVKAAADISIRVLSDLVLFSPSKAGFKFGERIQCDDFLIRQIVKSQAIDADFGLYINLSDDFKDDLITTKKCKNENQFLTALVTMNSKKFLSLEKIIQVKALSSSIVNIIFEDNLLGKQLLKEIDNYLSTHSFEDSKIITASGCNPPINNCVTCKTPTICSNCSASYLPNEDGTQCCAGEYCKTCNDGFGCDSCIDNYIFHNGQCLPCPQNCALCNTTACVECDPGYFVLDDTMCLFCSTGCEICHAGPLSDSICTQCYDPTNSVLTNGECSCIKANQIYSQNNICVCAPGYYEDTNGICQPCNTGCQTCTSPSQCITCFDKTFTIVNADGSCSCKTNELTYNTTTHTCDCPRGEYPDSKTALCDPCQDSCALCIAYDICFECINNSILYNTGDGNCTCADASKIYDPTTNTCVSCPIGKYAFQGNCYKCQVGCSDCEFWNECTECYPGMHLATSNEYCECDDPKKTFNPSTNTCGDCEKEGGCGNGCAEGCNLCASPEVCETCYDSENMVNKNGVCSCANPNQKFSVSEKKCVDNSSAKGLVLAWILALYAAI
ncbi:unnamed protein product [Blepharisma stoltei]|uniref:Uncharacterized protein n=1 Tax=Blepharisma stoltei TaxID=1481888 RepID=A0AAU9JQ53_9CILI|nr:unnamed protein product [Blepharisma stoltei]